MKCSNRKNNGTNFVVTLRRITKIFLVNHTGLFIVAVILSLLNAIFQSVSILAYKELFSVIENSLVHGKSINKCMENILIVLFVELGIIVVQFFYEFYINEKAHGKIIGTVRAMVNAKLTKVPYKNFEDAKLFDQIDKAYNSIDDGIKSATSILVAVSYYVPFFIFITVYFGIYDLLLILMLLFTFVPLLIGYKLSGKVIIKNENAITNIRRRMDYAKKCIVSREYYKETRTLGATEHFIDTYYDNAQAFNKENMKKQKKLFSIDFIGRVLRAAGYILVFLVMFFSLVKGRIDIAVFGAVFISIEKINGIAAELFDTLGGSYQNAIKAGFIFDIIDLPIKEGTTENLPKNGEIVISDVNYKYPTGDKYVLKNINLHINKGECIAIVGENGSGKTTFTKVLMGLLEVSSGKVLYDGKNINDYSYESITDEVTGIFQNYQRYKMSCKDNITISNSFTEDAQKIDEVINKVELNEKISKMDHGLGTMLSKEFNGIDLSGGEWQSLSIARGIYKVHDLIILDEPTSAIDPLEETRLYHLFKKIFENKTVILVTHRLGAARLADRVLVMDRGQIVEDGSHESLINKNGLYAIYWEMQKKWYEVVD